MGRTMSPDRSKAILEYMSTQITNERSGVTARQIANATGIAPSTMYRFLTTEEASEQYAIHTCKGNAVHNREYWFDAGEYLDIQLMDKARRTPIESPVNTVPVVKTERDHIRDALDLMIDQWTTALRDEVANSFLKMNLPNMLEMSEEELLVGRAKAITAGQHKTAAGISLALFAQSVRKL